MDNEYHVHIITVGFDPEPSMDISGSGIPADVAYLLNDPNDERANQSCKIIADHIRSGNIGLHICEIDCYDFHSIYNKVIEIAEKEKNEHRNIMFHINFSRGTAIAVSAVCCAAFEINSQLYYVKFKKGEPLLSIKDRVIPIDIENIHDQVNLTKRGEEIFNLFKGREVISNTELGQLSGISSKGSLSRHTSKMEKLGLIECKIDGKQKTWIVTGKGVKILKRLELQKMD